jgi:phage-related minor tail protein
MADNERVITTVFRADISNFSKSTQDLNRYVSQVNSEFKLATAHLGKWSDSTEGLQAKLTQLNGVLTAEQKKLENMEQAYADLVAQGKQNTKEAQNLETAINNQRATVNSTIKNIEHYSESLKELEDAGVGTREELDKLNKENEELKENAKAFGGGLLKGFAFGLAGIATACVGVVSGLAGIVEETKELRTQMGQLEASFTEAGHSVEASEKTFGDLYSVLGDSGKATEASLQLGQIAKNEEELLEYTNILTGVYATFGDSLPVEGLAEAMNHTANLGSVQGVLADALEWSGVNVDTFNEQLAGLNTEEERAKLINDTLNGIYGETATKYKEVNKEVIEANKAQNEYNKAMADIGEKAQPIITQFKTAMVGVLQTVMEKFNEVDIAGLVGKITNGIEYLTTTVLPPLMTALGWVLDNLNWLVPVMGTVVGLISGISAGIKIYNTVVTIAKTVQQAWNLVMTANPIGLVITAIGLLVTAFVVLWNKCEGFRKFFIKMWESIKKIGSSVAETIGKVFQSTINTVKGVINGVISLINGAIRAINKISVKIPDWVPEFGGKTIGFNLKEIPKLAEGGIIDKPTLAMVGEAGREAVVPLENNTEWIDKLADKLGSKMGGGNTTNNFNYTFEKMETSRIALHKAQLETRRIVGGRA